MRRFGVALSLLPGCVFLPPIDEDPVPIEEQNLAPSIDPRKISPSFDTVPVIVAQPNTVTLLIEGLQDPNVEDEITLRLYADGKDDFIPDTQQIIQPNENLTRPQVQIRISDALLDSFRDENGNLSGRHRLELLISDRGFVDDAGPSARQVPSDGQMGYYAWELDLDLLND